MEPKLLTNLFALLNAYAEKTGYAESTVAKRALNNPHFFKGLRNGNSFTVQTYDNMSKWFSENWPEGTDWPENVERPVLAKVAA